MNIDQNAFIVCFLQRDVLLVFVINMKRGKNHESIY